MAKKKSNADGALATNNKAKYNYFIGETYEAGIELTGTEIKSVRASKITIAEGLFKFVMGKPGWIMFTLVHSSKGTVSITNPCVVVDCCCTKRNQSAR